MTTTMGVMTSKGTKRRTIRVDDQLWSLSLEVAAARGDNLPDVIRAALAEYVKGYGVLGVADNQDSEGV